jgi:CubicO group peptidase (beta-lactamase class C family)
MNPELKTLLEKDAGFSGATAVILHRGSAVASVATGTAKWEDGADVTDATLFDLASITKMFVTVAALRLGPSTLDLDEPISRWLPSCLHGDVITPRHLLTHTSGLPAIMPLVSLPSVPDRVEAVLQAALQSKPGAAFEYSCIGFILLGFLLERITGTTLPALIHEEIIAPLGLDSTGYLPDQAQSFAATEFQPALGRGMVSGIVHDETSWSLGGTAGNAGIFSTATDLAHFGEALRAGHLLPPSVLADMTRDHLPSWIDPGFRHGFGVRINAPTFMGPLEGFGHTGFTGTSLVVDPSRELVVALLTNRVHPRRDLSDVTELRCEVAKLASQCA